MTTAGLVITRQRPGSASGVTFVTMEDETGYVNLIVWNRVADEQRAALLESRLLEVRGKLQREGDVQHVIAQRLTNLSAMLGDLAALAELPLIRLSRCTEIKAAPSRLRAGRSLTAASGPGRYLIVISRMTYSPVMSRIAG